MKPVEVRQHDDGTWYCRPYLGRNAVTGKPLRPYRRFPDAADEGEALEMAREWVAGLSGAARLGASLRMSDVLDRYIAENESRWAANTAKSYRNCARWLEPVMGGVDAGEMRPALVEAAYNVLLLRGGRGGRPLAQSSVRQVHEFLCGAFKWVVAAEVAPFNPMPSVRKPRLDAAEAPVFRMADFRALQARLTELMAKPETAGGRAAVAAYLSLSSGMRCGEACAIALGDVNLEARMLHIAATVVEPRGKPPARQPFTKGRRARNVAIGSLACEKLAEAVCRRRVFLPAGVADDPSVAVACTPAGGLARPSAVSKEFTAMRRELGLPAGTSFHTLRHTHATMLIASGADMRTVQERLGHANVATTLALYAHVVPGRDQAAADAFDDAARRIGGE